MDTYSFILKHLFISKQDSHESQIEYNSTMGAWKLIVLFVKLSIAHVLNP
jgi:hypothetical protein